MEINVVNDRIVRAAEWIKNSRHTTVFTGGRHFSRERDSTVPRERWVVE